MQENNRNFKSNKPKNFGRQPNRHPSLKSDRRPSIFQEDVNHSLYVEELDKRLTISHPVATGVDGNGMVALLFDEISGAFTVVQKDNDVEVANIYDTIAREQWGGKVLVIGHKKQNVEGFIASGHISIRGTNLRVKFANERVFDCVIDQNTPCLSSFHLPVTKQSIVQLPLRGPRARLQNSRQNSRYDSERNFSGNDVHTSDTSCEEDFTEEDLKRLRGEISLESPGNQSHQHQKNRFR